MKAIIKRSGDETDTLVETLDVFESVELTKLLAKHNILEEYEEELLFDLDNLKSATYFIPMERALF